MRIHTSHCQSGSWQPVGGGSDIAEQSIGATGYIKFSSGLVYQWGKTPTKGDMQYFQVVLPKPLTVALYSVTASFNDNRANYEANPATYSKTSFYIYTHTASSGIISWFAIGK